MSTWYGTSPMSTPTTAQSEPRVTIATFGDYADAEAFVDRLADSGIDVKGVTIVARDLRVVEHVTGKLNGWRAALGGTASGALFGLFFGLLFGALFSHDGTSFLAIILYWIVTAAIVGCILSLFAYALSGGQRNFTSVSSMTAGSYDVVADVPIAAEAARLVVTPPTTPTTTPTTTQ